MPGVLSGKLIWAKKKKQDGRRENVFGELIKYIFLTPAELKPNSKAMRGPVFRRPACSLSLSSLSLSLSRSLSLTKCMLKCPVLYKDTMARCRQSGEVINTEKHVLRNERAVQRESFWDGFPAGSFGRTSRVKNFRQALETLEKQEPECTDIHDPNARTSMTPGAANKPRAQKLRADFLFPIFWGIHSVAGPIPRNCWGIWYV